MPPNRPSAGRAPIGDEEGRERDGGRPSLRPRQEEIDALAPDLVPLGLHQRRGLRPGQRQLARPQLGHAALRAHAGDRELRLGPRGERQHRGRREVVGDGRERGDRAAIVEHVHVVEDEHERRVRAAAARRGGDRAPRRRQQPVRIVVAFVERHPGERAPVALAPFQEQGRLAVSGRRHEHRDRRSARRAQRMHEPRPRHARGRDPRPRVPGTRERRDDVAVLTGPGPRDEVRGPVLDRGCAQHGTSMLAWRTVGQGGAPPDLAVVCIPSPGEAHHTRRAGPSRGGIVRSIAWPGP